MAVTYAPVMAETAYYEQACNERSRSILKVCKHVGPGNGAKQCDAVKAGTANVCTLHPHSKNISGLEVNGRTAVIEQQFYDHGYHIIGVQEGRNRYEQYIDSTYYHMFVTAASAEGLYGVQLWIAKQRFYIPKAIRILSTRLIMLATIEKQSKHVYICISGHAPTEAALASEKECFYDALHSNLRGMHSAYPSALVVCCLDANGTVGQTKANGIGECQPERETANGALLRNFLTEFQLYAVNTYFQAGPTWVSGHGNSRRIDYIITCSKVHCNTLESFTDKELEIGTTAKIDHYVVAAEFEQPQGALGIQPSKARLRINVTSILIV